LLDELEAGFAAKLCPVVIPGHAKHEPGISRFRVWSGACHRAAQKRRPVGTIPEWRSPPKCRLTDPVKPFRGCGIWS